jgi:hypothetical protein
MPKRNYQFYTSQQNRWLASYARKLGFERGTRTPDGAWDKIGADFRQRFGRRVTASRLAFRARTLVKQNGNGHRRGR